MGKHKKLFILTIIILIYLLLLVSGCGKKEAEGTITVIFDGNGGTLINGQEIQTVNFNAEIEPPRYQKDGYAFSGWNINIQDIFTNTKIVALWTRSFDVVFDGNGGQLINGAEHQNIVYGDSADAPIYEKQGYALSWDKSFDSIIEDTTVTAIWTPTYTVTFKGNGGTHISGQLIQAIPHGNSAIPPVFTKEMYLLSWSGDFDNVTSDLIIDAVWELKTYTVTFNRNGGQLVSGSLEQIVEHGKGAIAPFLKLEGYTLYWDKSFYCITNNTTITAEWIISTYTVTFDGDGGILISGKQVQQTKHGDNATAPTYEKDGFIFNGWDYSPNKITQDIQITAIWEAIP